jgi:hypothetical protein
MDRRLKQKLGVALSSSFLGRKGEDPWQIRSCELTCISSDGERIGGYLE